MVLIDIKEKELLFRQVHRMVLANKEKKELLFR